MRSDLDDLSAFAAVVRSGGFREAVYYPGRRLLPALLRAFVDFVKASQSAPRV